MPQVTSILLCFNYLNAYIIEAGTIIFSCLGALNLYFTQKKLPWYADSLLERKIFLFSSICFLIIIFFLSIIKAFFRFKGIIKSQCNCFSFYLSLICIFSSLFGLITDLFMYVLLMTNMKYYNLAIKSKKSLQNKKLVTDQEWTNTIISMILSLLIWVMLILLAMSDNLRIDLKTNASYNKYLEAIDDAKKDNVPENETSEVLRGYREQRKKKNQRKQIVQSPNEKKIQSTQSGWSRWLCWKHSRPLRPPRESGNKKTTSKQIKKGNEKENYTVKEINDVLDEINDESAKYNNEKNHSQKKSMAESGVKLKVDNDVK